MGRRPRNSCAPALYPLILNGEGTVESSNADAVAAANGQHEEADGGDEPQHCWEIFITE
jgi:hypothetical protein